MNCESLRQQVVRLKVFVADPTHAAPLHDADGLLQERDPVRVTPVPHVALQAVHPDQDDHPPLTAAEGYIEIKRLKSNHVQKMTKKMQDRQQATTYGSKCFG